MPRTVFLAVLMLSVTCGLRAQDMGGHAGSSAEKSKQEILKVEDDMNQAIVRGDVAMLERIFADDFTVTNPSGKIISRAQDLEEIKIGDNKLLQLNHDEIRVRVYGDTAVLSGRSRSTLQYKGNISKGPRRFTNVYVKEDGHWRIVDHHVTNVVGQ